MSTRSRVTKDSWMRYSREIRRLEACAMPFTEELLLYKRSLLEEVRRLFVVSEVRKWLRDARVAAGGEETPYKYTQMIQTM